MVEGLVVILMHSSMCYSCLDANEASWIFSRSVSTFVKHRFISSISPFSESASFSFLTPLAIPLLPSLSILLSSDIELISFGLSSPQGILFFADSNSASPANFNGIIFEARTGKGYAGGMMPCFMT